jgi:hypothetical protein
MAETTTPQASQPLKYTITHYRKQGVTHEEMMKYIVEEHLPLALPVLKKHGVISYSLVSDPPRNPIYIEQLIDINISIQFVTPASLNEDLKQQLSKQRPTWETADCDCFIEYLIPDMGAIANVLADPDWLAALAGQEKWINIEKAMLSLGYSTPYLLETGEIVNLV